MESIQSVDNQKMKHIKKLAADKKHRFSSKQYVAEGVRWVFDALKIAPHQIEGVFFKESTAQKLGEVLDLSQKTLGGDRVFLVADAVFDKTADTQHSQGVLAVLRAESTQARPEGNYCLVLDRIRDPGNLGTIIRTAVAANFCEIVLVDCVDAYNPKVVRSSMSALLTAKIMHAGSDVLEQLTQHSYTILAADMNGENVFTSTEKFDKIALIIGSEADGISPKLLAKANKTVSIPMLHVESLNAAVSAGILMYQVKQHVLGNTQ